MAEARRYCRCSGAAHQNSACDVLLYTFFGDGKHALSG